MGAETSHEGEPVADPVSGPYEWQTEAVAADVQATSIATANAPVRTRRELGKRLGAWLGLAMAAPSVLASQGCSVGKLVSRYGENLNEEKNVFFRGLCETFLDAKKLMESIVESYEGLSIDEIEERLPEYKNAVREMAMLEGRYKAMRTQVWGDDLYRAVVEMETNEIVPLLGRFQALQNYVRDGRAEKHEKRLLKLTDDNWMAEIMQGDPILIMGSADWCTPCKNVMPVVAEYASAHGKEIRVRIAKLEDASGKPLMPKLDAMLAENEIEKRSYPTFYLFVEGILLAYNVGAFSNVRLIEKFVKEVLEDYYKQPGTPVREMNGQDSI